MEKNIMRIKTLIIIPALSMLLFCGSLQAQRSLYSDVKAHKQGDVITVVLTENITGSSSSDARSNSNTSGSAAASVSGSMLPMDAVFGANSQVGYSSDERGLANQRQLLQGTLSVRISDVDQNGNYQITGTRRTEISGEVYKMDLMGFVRAEDINDANEVLSYRIADAEITYLSEKKLGSAVRKPGISRRVIWALVGLATGVSTVIAFN
ncbi:MAG: flagellar basal body L-ring protein FlgH [Balneolaceae bacterium]